MPDNHAANALATVHFDCYAPWMDAPRRLMVPPPPCRSSLSDGPDQLPDDAEIGPFTRDGVVVDHHGRKWSCGPLLESGVWLGGFDPIYPIRSRWLDAPLAAHAGRYEAAYGESTPGQESAAFRAPRAAHDRAGLT